MEQRIRTPVGRQTDHRHVRSLHALDRGQGLRRAAERDRGDEAVGALQPTERVGSVIAVLLDTSEGEWVGRLEQQGADATDQRRHRAVHRQMALPGPNQPGSGFLQSPDPGRTAVRITGQDPAERPADADSGVPKTDHPTIVVGQPVINRSMSAVMQMRRLGDSGLAVSVVGLGCNNFGSRMDESAVAEVVGAALDSGIVLFDTADTYGSVPGQSESCSAERSADDATMSSSRRSSATR